MKPQTAPEVGKYQRKVSLYDRLHLSTSAYSKGQPFTSEINTIKVARAESRIKQQEEKSSSQCKVKQEALGSVWRAAVRD